MLRPQSVRPRSVTLSVRPQSVTLSVMRKERLGDQALFSLALLALASISEQVYDVFAVMLLWGGQPLW